jgi:folate-binding Fe-S cluster repair protein YgfZ
MHCNVHTANAYAPLTNTMQGRSNTRDLLQGITTNDCAPLERKGAPPRYAALLNSQGRVLHDMHLHRTRAPARRRSTRAWRTFRYILWLTS